MIRLFPPPRATPSESRPAAKAPDFGADHRAILQLDALVGHSAALARVFQRIRPAAFFDRLQVLLTGPSGSGKSLVARTIHENSARAHGPFVEVNCAAIPRDLFEAEFFGCTRNAYTHAADRSGRFAAAEGGTLFLDEIGEIPLADQAKLLRVLDEGRYERLGEDRTRFADVRVVAATNRDLEAAVASGAFRPDLYFRLNRYRIHVPSLAERREDVAELVLHLAEQQCALLGLPRVAFSAAALRALEKRDWPGNIRELQSVVAQAVIEASSEAAAQVEPRHCGTAELEVGPPAVVRQRPRAGPAPRTPADWASSLLQSELSYAEATREFQRRLIERTLAEEDWNVTRAAQRLAVARSHVYTLIDQFQLVRPQREGAS